MGPGITTQLHKSFSVVAHTDCFFYVVLVFDDPSLYPHNLNAILLFAKRVKIIALLLAPMVRGLYVSA